MTNNAQIVHLAIVGVNVAFESIENGLENVVQVSTAAIRRVRLNVYPQAGMGTELLEFRADDSDRVAVCAPFF